MTTFTEDSPATTITWDTAVPLIRLPLPKVRHVPKAFDIPLDNISTPQPLPPYLLFGKRDDTSFTCSDAGFDISYTWDKHGNDVVAQLLYKRGKSFFAEEQWQGDGCGASGVSTGAGKSLGEALQHHFGATLTTRDNRLFLASSGQPLPQNVDPRESYFEDYFESTYNIVYAQPDVGLHRIVHMPGGIDRVLVVPCFTPQQRARAKNALERYLRSDEAYVIDGVPKYLRHGSFSHRNGLLYWRKRGAKRFRHRVVEFLIYVGPWRAAVDLTDCLASVGVVPTEKYPGPFLYLPEHATRPAWLGAPLDWELLLPALIPLQEAYGRESGPKPKPIGGWPRLLHGGPDPLRRKLFADVERAFPYGQPRTIHVNDLRVKSIPFERGHAAWTPCLFLHLPEGRKQSDEVINQIAGVTRGALDYGCTANDAGDLLFIPSLPFQNGMFDPESVLYLVPAIARYVEKKLGSAWRVSGCGYEADSLRTYPFKAERWVPPGERYAGW